MQSNLVKATDETGSRSRADRSLQSGRVVTVNRTTNTVILDVGMVDNLGNGVYLVDVPFSPQSPPQEQDTVAILRTNSSAYSHVVGGGAQVGGANSGQVVVSGGAVSHLSKSGSTGLQGEVTLTGTGGADLTQTAQNIEIDAGFPTGGTTGQALVKASNANYDLAWSTPAGGGDFVGPSSSTDHAIVRFDGTTGKLGQGSGITIADGAAGALSGTNTGDETASGILTKLLTVDGSGSGLDADLLDGVSAAGFDAAGAAAAAQAASQPLDTELTALAGLTSANNKVPRFTGSGTADLLDFDTDDTLAANSDTRIASQKAVKTYADALVTGAAGSPVITANVQSGTSYTLVLSDAGKIVECTNASGVALTVPPNSAEAFAVGTTIEVWQGGAIFPVTIAPGSGVTLLSRGGLLDTNGQYATVRLRKQATDVWQVSGDTV